LSAQHPALQVTATSQRLAPSCHWPRRTSAARATRNEGPSGVLAVAVAALAAAGGSSPSHTPARPANNPEGQAFTDARCMRLHGVADFHASGSAPVDPVDRRPAAALGPHGERQDLGRQLNRPGAEKRSGDDYAPRSPVSKGLDQASVSVSFAAARARRAGGRVPDQADAR
jgi:hypothetical protein